MNRCTNCGYERQHRDEGMVPATECPRCHIIYDKIKDGGKGLEESVGELNYAGRITLDGLSLGARITLGIFAGFFGILMLYIASQIDKAVPCYLFGSFCLLIAVACVTKGRIRQFVGSLIGFALFALTLAYVGIELSTGVFWTGRQSEPSIINALMSFIILGIPGAAYAYKARFGLAWRLDDKSRMTGDCHVRIRGSVGVKFPRATRLINLFYRFLPAINIS